MFMKKMPIRAKAWIIAVSLCGLFWFGFLLVVAEVLR